MSIRSVNSSANNSLRKAPVGTLSGIYKQASADAVTIDSGGVTSIQVGSFVSGNLVGLVNSSGFIVLPPGTYSGCYTARWTVSTGGVDLHHTILFDDAATGDTVASPVNSMITYLSEIGLVARCTLTFNVTSNTSTRVRMFVGHSHGSGLPVYTEQATIVRYN